MDNLLIDFETYSEIDLKNCGVRKYVSDPSFKILCMAYKEFNPETLECGETKIWTFQKPEYLDLHKYKYIWALNSTFDLNAYLAHQLASEPIRVIDLPDSIQSWKDIQVILSKFSLPQSLAQAAEVLNTPIKKNPRANLIIKTCCKKNTINPTQANYQELFDYCVSDVDAAFEVIKACPSTKIEESEWQLWRETFLMNYRGLPIQYDVVQKIKERCDAYKQVICDSLPAITEGKVTKPTQTKRIKDYLNANGVLVENATADTLEKLIERDDREHFMPENCRMLVEARQAGGASSVAKFDKLLDMRVGDNVHDFLRYGATNTQRWAGSGYQVHSLPKKTVEDPEALIKDFLDFNDIENPLQSAKALCRSVIKAPPGQMLYQADYSSIEYLLLIWITDMHDMLQMFKEGKSAYIDMAAYLFNKPYEDIDKHAIDNLEYFLGKQAILGCLAEGTLVLTDKGSIPIEQVTLAHKLWDGDYWVSHQGLLDSGVKKCIKWNGSYLTPEHKVFIKDQTKKEAILCLDSHHFQLEAQAINLATGKLSNICPDKKYLSCLQDKVQVTKLNVDFVEQQLYSLFKTLKEESLLNVETVEDKPDLSLLLKHIAQLQEWTKPQSTGLSIDGMQQSLDVLIRRMLLIDGMGPEALKCVKTGWKILDLLSSMLRHSLALTMQTWNWTERITTRATNQGILDLLPDEKTCLTHDILEVGSRNRFTILTPKGPAIVSNCGYQMGAKKFKETCAGYNANISSIEADRAVKGYRLKYRPIKQMWDNVLKCCVAAITAPGEKFHVNKCEFLTAPDKKGTKWLIITLPSKTKLYYHSPEVAQGKYGPEVKHLGLHQYKWCRRFLSPGRITENIIQKLARDLMGYSILQVCEDKAFDMLMTVHDEAVSLGSDLDPDNQLKYYLDLIERRPEWAETIPLKAGGYYGSRYKKD